MAFLILEKNQSNNGPPLPLAINIFKLSCVFLLEISLMLHIDCPIWVQPVEFKKKNALP